MKTKYQKIECYSVQQFGNRNTKYVQKALDYCKTTFIYKN